MSEPVKTTLPEACSLALAGRALLFGLRMTIAVCASLFIAFYLQLENPSWAGTSAAIVCQPILGASVRKGFFRIVGTGVGAVATVLLTACFPQDRFGFFMGLAIWCGACSFVSTLLRNFSAYAAMLAGYTMAIIASTSIVAPDQVFTSAVSRATEIGVGIVCGMIVMSLTAPARSLHNLSQTIAEIIVEIYSSVLDQLLNPQTPDRVFRPRRRQLVKRVAALDSVLDQAIGESLVAKRRRAFAFGIQGLFVALSAWRTLGTHLDQERAEPSRDCMERQLRGIGRGEMASAAPIEDVTLIVSSESAAFHRDNWITCAQACQRLSTDTTLQRFGAGRIASIFEGMSQAANAIVPFNNSRGEIAIGATRLTLVPDFLPPLVNGIRVFSAVAAAEVFYVVTAWPDGLTFITFLAITVLLQSPREELGFRGAVGFGVGMALVTAIAGLVKFVALPNHEGFFYFAIVVGLALIPLGALATRPDPSGVFVVAATNLIPLLGPTNQMIFDGAAFANNALAIVGGSLIGIVVLRIVPPIPKSVRSRRLLFLTLRDLRRLMRRPHVWPPNQWRARVFARLVALPQDAPLVDGSRLLAALTVGMHMITLGEAARNSILDNLLLRQASDAFCQGRMDEARIRFYALEKSLDETDLSRDGKYGRRQLQVAAREVSETIITFPDYFKAHVT